MGWEVVVVVGHGGGEEVVRLHRQEPGLEHVLGGNQGQGHLRGDSGLIGTLSIYA